MVLFIEAARERRWPRADQLLVFLIAWIGLVLVAAPEGWGALGPDAREGALFALGAALTYAVFLTSSESATLALGAVRFTALSNVGTLAALVIVTPWVSSASDFVFPAPALVWMAVVVLGCTVVPFFLLSVGIARAGAGPASLLTLVGPPITVGAAFVILDERLSATQLLGAALVLGSVGSLKWRQYRARRREAGPEV